MEMKQKRLRRVLWWLFLILFLGSGVWLGFYALTAFTGAQAIQSMSGKLDAARIPASGAPIAAPQTTAATPSTVAATAVRAQATETPGAAANAATGTSRATAAVTAPAATAVTDPLLATYRAFAAENSDMVGWIHIGDTGVDYPVMHTPTEPQRYLHRDFAKRYSFAGLPFLDARCDLTPGTQNRIVYAHNMRSGQMFAQLLRYLDAEFLAAHPVIDFDTLSERGAYEVFAVLQIDIAPMYANSMECYRLFDTDVAQDVQRLNAYLQQYARVRLAEVLPGDSILTLSTCQRLDSVDRLVVMARKAAQQPVTAPTP